MKDHTLIIMDTTINNTSTSTRAGFFKTSADHILQTSDL